LNEAGVIEHTLRQTAALTGSHETIVVDGGSTDGTVGLARRHATVIESPAGRAVQMNAGARAARGSVLLFLHADTVLPSNALEAIEGSLKDGSVIGGRFRVRLDNNRWAFRVIGAAISGRDALIKGFTGDQAIYIRTTVFRELRGYAEIPLMEDLDLGRRMCRRGKVARLQLSVTTSARRWQNHGVCRTILLMWTLRVLYLVGCPAHRLSRFYRDAR
jgi:rSAM/selenodomain-associated transferase 2